MGLHNNIDKARLTRDQSDMETSSRCGYPVSGMIMLASAILLSGCATGSVDQLARSKWVEVRTEHFVVLSEADVGWANRLVDQLEGFRSFMQLRLGVVTPEDSLPFRIVLVGGNSNLSALVGRHDIFGAFQPTNRGGLAVVDVSARASDGTSSLDITYTPLGPIYRTVPGTRYVSMDGVVHEYVHFLLASDPGHRYPLWFNEGYAEYLSTFSIGRDGRARIGAAPPHRHEALAPSPSGRNRSVAKARWVPLEFLFNQSGYKTGHGYGDFYAQSWAVVHYMMSDPERAELTAQFLEAINKGDDPVLSLESIFNVSIRGFSARARGHGRSKTIKATKYEMPETNLKPAVASDMKADQIDTLIAEIVTVFQGDIDGAIRHLDRALEFNPTNMLARAQRAEYDIYRGNLDTAQARLEAAGAGVASSPEINAAWGHYFIARASEAINTPQEGWEEYIVQARRHYEKAIKLDATFADAYLGLGRSYLVSVDNLPDRVFEILETAQRLLPINLEIDLLLGHFLFCQQGL